MIDLELPEVIGLTDELTATAPRNAREAVRSAVYRVVCQTRFSSLDLTEADRVSEFVSAVGDPLVESAFWSGYSSALALAGRYREALVGAAALSEIATKYRLDFALPWAMSAAGIGEAGLRNWRRAEELLTNGIAHARGVNNAHAEQHCLAAYIRTLLQQGKRQQALALASEDAAGPPAPVPIPMLAEFAATRALAMVTADRVEESRQLVHSIRGLSKGIEARVITAAVEAIGGLKLHSADSIEKVEDFSSSALSSGALDLLVTAYRSSSELLTVLLRSERCSRDIFMLLQRSGDEDLAVALGLPPPSRDDPLVQLTARQREVYGLLRQGLSNREIANLLYITEATAKLHVQRIFDKTGVRSRKAIAMQAALERSPQATSAIDETGVGSDDS
jgi:DNA-binding NarL/FixJ family response regulator